MAMMNDHELSDAIGIRTEDLDRWMRKSLLVDPTSRVYARMPDGDLMRVKSVRIDSQGDLLFGLSHE